MGRSLRALTPPTICNQTCSFSKTTTLAAPTLTSQEKLSLNQCGTNERGRVGYGDTRPEEADVSRDVSKRLLVRRSGRLARDMFAPLDAPAAGLRKRLQQRGVARQVLGEECKELLHVVVQEANFDPVAKRVERDLKLTLAVAAGGQEVTAEAVEQKKIVSRVATFLKRKTISDMMVSLVSRGQWALSFAHWKDVMVASRKVQEEEPEEVPALEPCKKSMYGNIIQAGFCAAWEKVIARHESLVAGTLAVAAGASLPMVAVS